MKEIIKMRHYIAVYSESTSLIESVHENCRLSDEEISHQFHTKGRCDLWNGSIEVSNNATKESIIGTRIETYQKSSMNEMDRYIQQDLLSSPLVSCDFKIDDEIIFTNENGIEFDGLKVIGFSHDSYDKERFIHVNSDAYWFPKTPKSIRLANS